MARTRGRAFIGLECEPATQAELKRRAAARGWSITRYVLTALDAAFAADHREVR